ncbi:phage portal protein [Aeromicrobium sp.]|uniref:phage portal protein n=1 Tax=Aeromicrobium sp. TaxID=1871063 RepID=UPI0030C3F462
MTEIVARLSRKLDEQANVVRGWEQRYNGEVPLTFLSVKDRQALGDRLKYLNVNLSRLAVDALAERIRVVGFKVNGQHDADLWERWQSLGMEEGSGQAVTDALMCGRGFVSVWANEDGPMATPEAAAQCIIERDPVTREGIAGLKRWTEDGKGWSVLYEPWQVTTYKSLAGVPEGGMIPADGWTQVDSRPSPLGVLTLHQVTNRGRVSEAYGVSDMAQIADLNDALVKTLVDALVTSEAYARPKRWATGLAIVEDADGNPQDPFTESMKLWQAEQPDTKFGDFAQADLGGYGTLVGILLNQISALSGLPSHYLSMSSQPISGEETKARETSLVSRAEAKIRSVRQPFADIARQMVAIRDGVPVRSVRVEPLFADPATRTQAQDADAATKLHAEGLLSVEATLQRIGMSPDEISDDKTARLAEAALRMAANL